MNRTMAVDENTGQAFGDSADDRGVLGARAHERNGFGDQLIGGDPLLVAA